MRLERSHIDALEDSLPTRKSNLIDNFSNHPRTNWPAYSGVIRSFCNSDCLVFRNHPCGCSSQRTKPVTIWSRSSEFGLSSFNRGPVPSLLKCAMTMPRAWLLERRDTTPVPTRNDSVSTLIALWTQNPSIFGTQIVSRYGTKEGPACTFGVVSTADVINKTGRGTPLRPSRSGKNRRLTSWVNAFRTPSGENSER